MKLGVVGDLHGNMSGLWKALDALKLRGVEGICLTGDMKLDAHLALTAQVQPLPGAMLRLLAGDAEAGSSPFRC